ncbi:MAG TPA: hypothetical protein VHY82_10700, partial [Acetobacteraceae bacterium]|nr:hypothetical protein [Acetobacteraceae bacterium]
MLTPMTYAVLPPTDRRTLPQDQQATLTDNVWLLEDDGEPDRHLFLLPSGRIGAGWGSGLTRWVLDEGRLYLLDHAAERRYVFAVPESGTTLLGESLPARQSRRLTLRRNLPPPVVPNDIVAPFRRNLVVLRAGPGSLHPLWLDGCPPDGRSWDLCISWFGDETADIPGPFDRVIFAKGSKFQGLSKFVAEDTAVWGYDYVWFPDDDLMIAWQD